MQTKFDIGQRVFFASSRDAMPVIGSGLIDYCKIDTAGITYATGPFIVHEADVYADVDSCASALIRAAATVFEEREGAIRVRMNELKQQYPPETVQLGSFS